MREKPSCPTQQQQTKVMPASWIDACNDDDAGTGESIAPRSAMDGGATGIDMQAKANAQERFVAAIEQTPTLAIQGLSRDGTIQIWNQASAKLYGVPRAEALGKPLWDVLQLRDVAPAEFAAYLRQIWDTGQPGLPSDWHVTSSSGKTVWVYSSLFPIVKDGKTVQIFCMDVDITARKDDEDRLAASETRFREFFKRSADAIILLRDGQFDEFNPAALAMFGYDDDTAAMSGLKPQNVSPPYQPDGRLSQDKMHELTSQALRAGNQRFEWLYSRRDNQLFWAETLLTAMPSNGETMLYAVVRDITCRKEAEQALRLAAEVFQSSHEAILITDRDRRIISVNPSFTEITGYTPQQAIGTKPRLLSSGLYQPEFYERMWKQIDACDHWQGELWARRSNGRIYPVWLSVSSVRDDHGTIQHYIGIFSDITERKEAERHIRHMIEHDFLTGLPNRVLLLDRLQLAIATARRNHTKLAVLFLDLDRFKNVNDTLGHHIGDKLLQSVAERLKKCVRSNDTVSRQGGDEFVIMLAEIGGVEQAAHIASVILKSVSQTYRIDEHTLDIGTSIGIALYPDDGADMDALIKNADTAMYHAKESGRGSYQFFNSDMNARMVARITLENQLRRALRDGEFFLQYQPEVDIASGATVGVEALLRWRHPQAGVMTPQQFLPVAEESGLIVPIGDWVLRQACMQGKTWFDQGMPVVVGVNLSATQFRQKQFARKILDLLQEVDLAPHLLELEITESVLIDSTDSVMDTMQTLREAGVKLAVDDFGTGYSSLSYLKHFPVDKLKIDQSFVRDLQADANDAAIIRAILIMAKSLNLKVIAEGVETDAQLRFLHTQGCDEYQGYYLTRPMPARDLPSFYRTRQAPA